MKEKNEEILQPSFYTVIPSNVRYCKDLSYFEIVLYSEIVARTNAKNYCWTKNSTFAKLYDMTIRSVSKAISHLQQLGFIQIKYITNNNIKTRYILLSSPKKKKVKSNENNYSNIDFMKMFEEITKCN